MERTDKAAVMTSRRRMVGHRRVVGGLALEPARRERQQPSRTGGCDRFRERSRAFGGAVGGGHRPSRHVVIATADAVLVADRSQTDKVKRLVERLKAEGHRKRPSTAHIPAMGLLSERGPGHALPGQAHRRRPGGRLSLQKHHHRAEHWVVVHGAAEVTIDRR